MIEFVQTLLQALQASSADVLFSLANCDGGWELVRDIVFEDGSIRLVLTCPVPW